ncbi:hypothetical protein AVEN_180140-1 [Araneus ventricosus]|uniref:Uncharacterized protein n=1 Tax=Araneus ventricosus TaxID=182803 RepID=A0A4Y2D5M5_ARAVE|nr:hypothetical protein AVEN_180140-1 [Araneus ventricosus]
MNLVILNRGQVTKTTPEWLPPVRTSAPHQREDVGQYGDFYVQQVAYTADLQWNSVLNLESCGQGAETLPLGHSGLCLTHDFGFT